MICDDCGESDNYSCVCEDCERELCPECYGARQFNDGSSVCVACDDTVELEDE